MKIFLLLFFPILIFSQKKDDWSTSMHNAMEDIKVENFTSAITNLDQSLLIVPNNWSALYFKAYSQIIIGKKNEGCSTLIDAIYYDGNDDTKKLYAEKCIDFNPKINAEKFKSGKFSLQILNDPLIYNFERRNDMQYESFDGKIYSGKVNWLENGDYNIVATNETEKIMSENPQFYVRILKVAANKYLYEKVLEKQVQFGIITKTDQ